MTTVDNHVMHLIELLVASTIVIILVTIASHFGMVQASLSSKHIAQEIAQFVQAARLLALEQGKTIQLCNKKVHHHSDAQLHLLVHEENTWVSLREYQCQHCTIRFKGFQSSLSFDASGKNSTNGTFEIWAKGTVCYVIINDAGRVRVDCKCAENIEKQALRS